MNESGIFDPRFPGISLKFDPTNFSELYAQLSFEAQKANPLEKILSPETELAGFSVKSALVHEARHLFDFYTSPWFSMTMDYRIRAVVSAFKTITELRNMVQRKFESKKPVLIPAPLAEFIWLSVDEREYAIQRLLRQLEYLGVNIKDDYLVCDFDGLPEFTRDARKSPLRYAKENPDTPYSYACSLVETYEDINWCFFSDPRYRDHPGQTISSYAILEFSAISTQLAVLNNFQTSKISKDVQVFLRNTISTHPLYSQFLVAFDFYKENLLKLNIPLLAIFSWAISGSLGEKNIPSNPSERFAIVLNELNNGKKLGGETDPMSRLDNYFGVRDYRHASIEALTITSGTGRWLSTHKNNLVGDFEKYLFKHLEWYTNKICVRQVVLQAGCQLGYPHWDSEKFYEMALEILSRFPILLHSGSVEDESMLIYPIPHTKEEVRTYGHLYTALGNQGKHVILNSDNDDITHWKSLYKLFQLADHLTSGSPGNPKFQTEPDELNSIFGMFSVRPFYIL